jgi:hypothetical protein
MESSPTEGAPVSDFADPHNDTEGMRADSGDPNRDRDDQLEQPPTEVDDAAVRAHLEDRDDETEHDAPTAAE